MERCTDSGLPEAVSREESERMSEFLKVFADPDRIRIMSLLRDREVCVGHIARALGKSISAVSHQLGLMRRERLVRYVRDGKNTYYTLDDEHISVLIEAAKEHCGHGRVGK